MEEPGKADWVKRRARLFSDTANNIENQLDRSGTGSRGRKLPVQSSQVQVQKSPDRKRARNSPVLHTPVNSPLSGISSLSPVPNKPTKFNCPETLDHSTLTSHTYCNQHGWNNCNSPEETTDPTSIETYCKIHGWINCELCNTFKEPDLTCKESNSDLMEKPDEPLKFNLPNLEIVHWLEGLDKQWRNAFSYAFLFYEARKDLVNLTLKACPPGLKDMFTLHHNWILKFLKEGDDLRNTIRALANKCNQINTAPEFDVTLFARLSIAELTAKSNDCDNGLLFHTKRFHRILEHIHGDLDLARSLAEADKENNLEEETTV